MDREFEKTFEHLCVTRDPSQCVGRFRRTFSYCNFQ